MRQFAFILGNGHLKVSCSLQEGETCVVHRDSLVVCKEVVARHVYRINITFVIVVTEQVFRANRIDCMRNTCVST